MNFRKNYPGAGQYTLPQDKTWTEQGGKKAAHADFTKAPRRMMAQLIADNATKPEKSTPSPQAYLVNKDKFLPSVGKGGASLLQAKADKVTIFEEAMVVSKDTPGVGGYIDVDQAVHKRRASAVLFTSSKT
mmetsp:Transcript_6091/g.8191  ORF Transcript_6091/g.8191 Transcript_6091/m.8191 type:complete len:131 (+) Transcript_6091:422-814(+)|eukprot:CAMPEP_0185579276 /NCGR_PEP_ID=MMETSP0434-20130131/14184_1 /TAXON_ID=626734 ORGANISM="Favella taraikaensis, Strain Fe Narragansett Bay" /NCGR_SAMPLE_ID=MMETSP0434 /ASSEMBLY_ACC=CAM_ASM_000379 /LENGTH=130 /DNA_ID=CAMNT_0028197269 /DNA_START=421 /DNA_END=813 /DNA_ORIENTATION=+